MKVRLASVVLLLLTASAVLAQAGFTELDIPVQPHRLIRGPDDAMWFTTTTNVIGRWSLLSPNVPRYDAFTISGRSMEIARGHDGNVWFTESGPKIGRLTPA